MGGTLDSTGEFRDWRGIELLVRAGVGTAGEDAFPAATFDAASAAAAGGVGRGGSGEFADEHELSTFDSVWM